MGVVPSMYELFGIVALETMEVKTPMVASEVGGLSELIKNDKGLKVPSDISESLAACIVKIVSEENDGKMRVEVEERVEKGFKSRPL